MWNAMRTKFNLLFLAWACSGGTSGCLLDWDPGDPAIRTIQVVATTGMIADAVHVIGGDRVEIHTLMGPGVDPHLYRANEGDVNRMSRADLVFYNGFHLEAKLADVLARMGGRIRTVAVAEAVPKEQLLRPPEFEGAYDPHVWMDVSLWMTAVRRIEEALSGLDPASAELYRRNLEAYLLQLAELHEYVGRRIGEIPAQRRVLVTAHDAFNYFGRAYEIEVRGLMGISTVAEAGTADIQNLATFIVERRVPAIFIETSVPPRSIQAVQAAVRARGFQVEIGGALYSDSLGSRGTPEETYVGMIRSNAETIHAALTIGPEN